MAQILIVEDDLQFAELLQDDLSASGHDVTICTNSNAALQHLEANPVDLILTDVFLEEGQKTGGITLVNQVRKVDGKKVPIIAMSGAFSGPAASQKQGTLMTVGADVLLGKPFKPQELAHLLDALLGDK